MDRLHPDLEKILITEYEIHNRVKEIAHEISQDYTDVESLYLIGILKGAFIFMSDLVRQLSVPHVVDFMAVSSYGKGAAISGEVRLVLDLREPVIDKHLLVVEDIVDTGQTLNYLIKTLSGRRPASLKTCALVRKERESLETNLDYLGFLIPDVWVVGYGLDFAERHRTLPYIAELKRAEYAG